MLENVQVLCHSSILINKNKSIYIDPFKIKGNYNNADIIFITHDHYDHYSEEDIDKVRKENTKMVVPARLREKVLNMGFIKENIVLVEQNNKYIVEEIKIQTVPAYNINKEFHPKQNNWVGYIIEIDGVSYYIAGDTDINEDNRKVKCDVALVPVGGTYTMTAKEAAELVNEIKPKIAIPTHYGEIVGSRQDAIDFQQMVNREIKCEILI